MMILCAQNGIQKYEDRSTSLDILHISIQKCPPCIGCQSLTMFYHPIEEFMISSWVIQEYCMIKKLLHYVIIFHQSSVEVRNFSDHFSQVLCWRTWLSIPTASASLPASTLQNRLSPVAGRLNVLETFRDFVTYGLWGPRPGSRSVGA